MLDVRIIGAVAVLAVTHIAAYRTGAESERLAAAVAVGEQAIASSIATGYMNEKLRIAQNEHAKALSSQSESSARAAAELVRLRDALRSSPMPDNSTRTTCDNAATIRELFGQCGEAVQWLAKEADGHAADSLMLQQAWPVNK